MGVIGYRAAPGEGEGEGEGTGERASERASEAADGLPTPPQQSSFTSVDNTLYHSAITAEDVTR